MRNINIMFIQIQKTCDKIVKDKLTQTNLSRLICVTLADDELSDDAMRLSSNVQYRTNNKTGITQTKVKCIIEYTQYRRL